MSIPLLESWGVHQHTALDDLESFIWVLLIVPVEISSKEGFNDPIGQKFINKITTASIDNICDAKKALRGDILYNDEDAISIPLSIRPLFGLIQALFGIVMASAKSLSSIVKKEGSAPTSDRFNKCITDSYEQFIRTGLDGLDGLGSTWSDPV